LINTRLCRASTQCHQPYIGETLHPNAALPKENDKIAKHHQRNAHQQKGNIQNDSENGVDAHIKQRKD